MLTRNEIKAKLDETAEKLNIEGDVKDAIVGLLTEACYLEIYNSLVTSYEASPSTCTEINSAITHARNKMFSVNRGYNQRVTITNIKPVNTFSVKKYETAGRVNGIYMLYAENYNFISGESLQIELILSHEEVVTETMSADSVNFMYIDSNEVNLSEDLTIYKEVEGELVPYPTTTDFKTSVASDIEEEGRTIAGKLMLLTGTDFSISVVNPFEFNSSDELTLKAIRYTEDTVEASDITKLTNFEFTYVEPGEVTHVNRIYTKDNERFYLDENCTIQTVRPENFAEYVITRSDSTVLEYTKPIYDEADPSNPVFVRYFYVYTIDGSTYYTDNGNQVTNPLPICNDEHVYSYLPTDSFTLRRTVIGVKEYTYTWVTYEEHTDENTQVTVSSPVPRETDVKRIFIGAHAAYVSGYMVRSKYDIHILAMQEFSEIGNSIVQVTDTKIIIWYVFKAGVTKDQIEPNRREAFIAKIKRAYYVDQEIELSVARPFEDTSIDLTINYKEVPDTSVIRSKIWDYCYMLSGTFDLFGLLSAIQDVPNVEYVSFDTSSMITSRGTFKVDLNPGECVSANKIRFKTDKLPVEY